MKVETSGGNSYGKRTLNGGAGDLQEDPGETSLKKKNLPPAEKLFDGLLIRRKSQKKNQKKMPARKGVFWRGGAEIGTRRGPTTGAAPTFRKIS